MEFIPSVSLFHSRFRSRFCSNGTKNGNRSGGSGNKDEETGTPCEEGEGSDYKIRAGRRSGVWRYIPRAGKRAG